MKFAHIADCHIGSWREPKLRDSSTKAFKNAIEKCADENVDFVLISGDLFNTALPPVDHLKSAVEKLKQLKDMGIPVYTVAGSHDFSATGKTMLDVLASAGLVFNAAKGKASGDGKLHLDFTTEPKTGVKIAGMIGKKGGLEKEFYESLERESLENEKGYKIFMFHSAITEMKPAGLEKMDSAPVSLLPRGFDYYAGGHVHIIDSKSIEGYKNIAYPGPLFPNSFSEIEKLGNGGFYIVEDGNIRYEPIVIHQTMSLKIDCGGKNPEDAEIKIREEICKKEFLNMIVTIRLFGELKTGRPTDINFRDIFKEFYDKGAFLVMKNANKLTSKEFEEVKVETGSVDEIEERIIKENAGQSNAFDAEKEMQIIKSLMKSLSAEKQEGETTAEFERRIKKEADSILKEG